MNHVARGLYEHRWLLALVASYAAAGKLLGLWLGVPVLLTLYDPATARFAYLVPVIYALARAGYIVAIQHPDQPLKQILREWLAWASIERVLGLLIGLLVLPPFLSVFTSLKSMIPILAPFSWDDALSHLDRAVHGGFDPWRLLQPMLGHAPITSVVAAAYHSWYFVVYLTVMGVCWSVRDRRLRMQFLMTFALCWILLGNVVATFLSSAGPCYFGSVTGLADPYGALLAYLDSVGAISRVPQEGLWQAYHLGRPSFRSGISAMPSLHVAMATLIALLAWRINRLVGMLATLYAVVIMVGSVHLAWHYAVDGYAGAAGTVAIWLLVGRCQRREAAPPATAAGDRIAVSDPTPGLGVRRAQERP